MKAIIIDDEQDGVKSLVSLLRIHCPQVNVVATANSIKDGIAAVNSYKFELLFLDIKMPQGTGFDVLNQVNTEGFETIITTAHDDYAIKAFRFSAIDYLLKPIDEDELVAAIKKAEARLNKAEKSMFAFNEAFANYKAQVEKPGKLAISTIDSILFLDTNEIIMVQAEGSYTRFVLATGEKILSSKSLKDVEEMLESQSFFRVHKSYLINLKQIKKISKQDGGSVIMSDGTNIEIAQRRKNDLWKVLGID